MKRQGFTLMELLIVIAIISMLATVLLPNLLTAKAKANDTSARTYIFRVVTGIEAGRNLGGAALPASPTTCFTYADMVRDPSSIRQCKYEPDLSTDTYKVTAESVSGNIWQFDGQVIVQVSTY